MPDILTYAFLFVGFFGGYFINEMLFRRNKALYKFVTCVRKKIPIAFLETDKAIYATPIIKTYKNLGVTENKELVILPRSAPKPCINLGGTLILHGDLYKSVASPQEFRLFINDRIADGWSPEDIAKFFEEIETTPPEILKAKLKAVQKGASVKLEGKTDAELAEMIKTNPDAYWAYKFRDTPEEFKKFQIYLNLPSVVKDFIYTGLNRVSIHTMLRELVYQRELEKGNQRNWIAIAIFIFLILIGVGFAFRFIFSTPNIMQSLGSMFGGSPQINPT